MAGKMEVDEEKTGGLGGARTEQTQSLPREVDYPSFDSDSYAKRYNGKIKIDRLMHIANICPNARGRAYELAVEEVRRGIDVGLYDRVCETAQKVLGEKRVPIDPVWMTQTGQDNDKKTRHLEDEIQRWRNLSNREKICQAYLEAARFYSRIGSHSTAISRYIESKSYASDTHVLLDINLRIIVASIQSGQLTHVKAEASHALQSDEIYSDQKKRSQATAALGLYYLKQARFDSAVQNFIDCHFSIHNKFPEAISGHDIALYGGLCALASYSRKQLKLRVLDNPDFKRFLELTPRVARLVRGFYDSEYGNVMSGLNDLRKDVMVDMYLAPNVEKLLSAIRGKALVQYFSPYSAMDMRKMAQAFNVSVQEMEKELSTCISSDYINAKIDSHSKIVYASTQNKRTKLFGEVLSLGDDFARDMKAVLLRQSLQQNNCIVSQAELMLDFDMDMGEDGKGGMMGAMVGAFSRAAMGFGGGPQMGGGGGGRRPQGGGQGRRRPH